MEKEGKETKEVYEGPTVSAVHAQASHIGCVCAVAFKRMKSVMKVMKEKAEIAVRTNGHAVCA